MEPLLEALVGKILQQALQEVVEEAEMAAMRAHKDHFDQACADLMLHHIYITLHVAFTVNYKLHHIYMSHVSRQKSMNTS